MIVGLGNPGSKYEKTKHNLGFMAVDRLAKKHGVSFKRNSFEAEEGSFFANGEKIILIKPQTFMNESGKAVVPLMTYFGIYQEEMLVVHDDLDLEAGRIRLRQKGGAGGHNGLKSIMSYLDSQDFDRLKIGIGRPKGKMSVVSHVLSPFDPDDAIKIDLALDKAVDALEFYLDGHTFVDTMNHFN